jgi:hypothetical protein
VATDAWQVSAVWAAWTTVAIYFVLGVFAWVQVLQARKLRESQALQAQELREAERQLREAEARPYVIIDFELGDRPPLMNLIVANLGRTMARNLRIEVKPPLQSSLDPKAPVPVAKLKLFTEPIPSLAPGKRIVFAFDSLKQRPKELPTAYQATLRYDGERGPLPPDEQHLDLELYYNLLSVDRKTIHNVNETLTEILRRFEQWSAGPEGGVLVLSPDEKHQRDQEFDTWAKEQQAAEQVAADGPGPDRNRATLRRRLVGAVRRLGRRG